MRVTIRPRALYACGGGSQSLNALGQVTGSFIDGGITHGLLYQAGRVTDIGSLGGSYSFGFALNAMGNVTGVSARADGQRHAFVYSQGRLTDLGAAIEAMHGKGFVESVAYGINSAGQVIGRYYVTVPGNPGQSAFRSFLATPVLQLFDGLLRDLTGVGPGKSLQDKVTKARQAYVAQNKATTCSGLTSLQKDIGAQAGKKIPLASAAVLQGEAAGIGDARLPLGILSVPSAFTDSRSQRW